MIFAVLAWTLSKFSRRDLETWVQMAEAYCIFDIIGDFYVEYWDRLLHLFHKVFYSSLSFFSDLSKQVLICSMNLNSMSKVNSKCFGYEVFIISLFLIYSFGLIRFPCFLPVETFDKHLSYQNLSLFQTLCLSYDSISGILKHSFRFFNASAEFQTAVPSA